MGRFRGIAGNIGRMRRRLEAQKEARFNAQFDPVTGEDEFGRTRLEVQTGIMRPKYESLRDETGALRGEFAYDPTKSEAFQALREQAMAAPGESPWAKMQLEKQALEQQALQEQALRSAQTATGEAQARLARFGGLGGGARERLAQGGAEQAMMARQSAHRQGMMDRLGIQEQDIARKSQLLGQVGTEELRGQEKNIGTLVGDVQGKAAFDLAKYKEAMAAYGAKQSAAAQRAASGGGGKGK